MKTNQEAQARDQRLRTRNANKYVYECIPSTAGSSNGAAPSAPTITPIATPAPSSLFGPLPATLPPLVSTSCTAGNDNDDTPMIDHQSANILPPLSLIDGAIQMMMISTASPITIMGASLPLASRSSLFVTSSSCASPSSLANRTVSYVRTLLLDWLSCIDLID